LWFEARQLSGGQHVVKELLGDNVAHAVWSAARAGKLLVISQVVAVVEREFFSRLDVSIGHDPNAASFGLGSAIGRATVVEVPGRVPFHAAVQVLLFV